VTTIDPDRQSGPAGQAAALAELAERHFELAMTAAPFDATVVGVDGYDAEVPDLSEEAAARQRDALAELQRRLDAIDPEALDGQDRITHAMLRRAFEDRRAELAAFLKERGIQTGVHYPVPTHRQPAVEHFAPSPLPVTERLVDEILTLPMSADHEDEEIDRVVAAVREFFGA